MSWQNKNQTTNQMWGHVNSEASDGGSVVIKQLVNLHFESTGAEVALFRFPSEVFSDILFLIGNL